MDGLFFCPAEKSPGDAHGQRQMAEKAGRGGTRCRHGKALRCWHCRPVRIPDVLMKRELADVRNRHGVFS